MEFFEFLGVKSLAEARQLDAKYVLEKALQYKEFWSMLWSTVQDDKFCVGNPYQLFINNKRWIVPLLTGQTSSEFFSVPPAKTVDEFRNMAVELFGEDADEFLELCNVQSGDIEEMRKRASVSGLEYSIRIAGQANDESKTGVPIYYYNFDAEIPGWDNPGTFHSVDLWFTFETLAKCWRPFTGKHYDLARQICNYWCNFIKSGDPNGKDSTGARNGTLGAVYRRSSVLHGIRRQPNCRNSLPTMKFLIRQYFKKN